MMSILSQQSFHQTQTLFCYFLFCIGSNYCQNTPLIPLILYSNNKDIVFQFSNNKQMGTCISQKHKNNTKPHEIPNISQSIIKQNKQQNNEDKHGCNINLQVLKTKEQINKDSFISDPSSVTNSHMNRMKFHHTVLKNSQIETTSKINRLASANNVPSQFFSSKLNLATSGMTGIKPIQIKNMS